MMRQIILCCTLAVAFATGAYAIQCYVCTPTATNNFCQDYKDGRPSQATTTNCNGYCFKADGNMNKVNNNNEQRFIISDCILQATADKLMIGGNDWCKTGDDAKRAFKDMISPTAGQNTQSSQTLGANSYVLPGMLDYVNYCKCDKDQCNSAISSMATSSVTIVMAVVMAMVVKMFY